MNQYTGFEGVDYIQAAAAMREEAGEMTVFVINADPTERHELTLDARSFEGWTFAEHLQMAADDAKSARNTYEHPDAVLPAVNGETTCEKGTVRACLAPLSWNVFRFTK